MSTDEPKRPQIFLCHANEDKNKALHVYRYLAAQGFSPWIDQEDLVPGQFWEEEIPKAIKNSDFVLVFLSETSIQKRGYVQKEFNLALDVLNEIPEGQIFIIPVRLDNCHVPNRFQRLHWCNLFEKDGIEKLVETIRTECERRGMISSILLRSQPLSNLSGEQAKQMLKEKGFADRTRNKAGRGITHLYEIESQHGNKVVIDHSTGLTWHRSGSKDSMTYKEAKEYTYSLNRRKFAGYNDWRLPTLEESMSLMEPMQRKGGLYIDPIFNKRQPWIWTSDKKNAAAAWYVDFRTGLCDCGRVTYRLFVRPVFAWKYIFS
jgi:hypothetical protein